MYYLLFFVISLPSLCYGLRVATNSSLFIQNSGKFKTNYNKIKLNITFEDEAKLQDLLGKKVSDLSNKELLDEIASLQDPNVDKMMDRIFDLNNLPSLERTEILHNATNSLNASFSHEKLSTNATNSTNAINLENANSTLNATNSLNPTNMEEKSRVIDEDLYEPTIGEFKMKYKTEEERINMAKNAITYILEDNMVLSVPIKKVIVNNGHIDTLFWRDSHKYIEIWIPLVNCINSKNLNIAFSTDNVKITNGDSLMLDLPLPGPIRADECVWESDNRPFPELNVEAPQTIHIVLTKRNSHKHIWKSLVRK